MPLARRSSVLGFRLAIAAKAFTRKTLWSRIGKSVGKRGLVLRGFDCGAIACGSRFRIMWLHAEEF